MNPSTPDSEDELDLDNIITHLAHKAGMLPRGKTIHGGMFKEEKAQIRSWALTQALGAVGPVPTEDFEVYNDDIRGIYIARSDIKESLKEVFKEPS